MAYKSKATTKPDPCFQEGIDKQYQSVGAIAAKLEWQSAVNAMVAGDDADTVEKSECYGHSIEAWDNEQDKIDYVAVGDIDDNRKAKRIGAVGSDLGGKAVKDKFEGTPAKIGIINKVKDTHGLKVKNGVIDGYCKACGHVLGSTSGIQATAAFLSNYQSARGSKIREYSHAEAYGDTSANTNSLNKKATFHQALASTTVKSEHYWALTETEKSNLYPYLDSYHKGLWEGWGYGGGGGPE